ncbi:MAG: DUF2191 domain-containing protein [Deltaproteobacteria bacterium]|nr:DUF2191 domain-containing protein [Deltaproteobacteria bacterium]
MKTTVDIADALLSEARALAEREDTTLKALLDEGLRLLLKQRRQPVRFRLRRATFRGQGLQPEVANASWNRLRELAYEDRGS